MSTMVSFGDNKLATNFMTMDQLKAACPVAFVENSTNPKVSERYKVTKTEEIVEALAKEGWYPVQAKQCRPKKNSKGVRSFHMIAFQNPNVKINKVYDDGTEEVDTFPRIILTNSHDGYNSFKFMVGLYRLVCSNGLCISDGEFEKISIRHTHDTEFIRIVCSEAVKRVPEIAATMTTMKNTEVTEEQKAELATEVMKIRKDVEEEQKFDIDEATIMEILEPTRNEDKGDDLWTVFNICQEKMIKGGFSATGKNDKVRKQRRITSVKKDIEYNRRLWDFAMRYVPANAAA